MASIASEFTLMLAYAACLAIIAIVLEWVARHAHRRSIGVATAGFTYHPDKDIWRCPQDQHLFPIFSDHLKGVVVYRAPASACNTCVSRAACTDSEHGRAIEWSNRQGMERGVQRFHRAISLTLLSLANLILIIELLRISNVSLRLTLAGLAIVLGLIIARMCKALWNDTTGVPA